MSFTIIAGSRGINNFDISKYIPENVELIIAGCAKGIDMLAEQYADKNKISKYIMRPDYKKYHKGAPIKRNEQMVDICDKVIVFWDGISKGTKHTIDYAQKIGKPLEIVIVTV